MSEPGVPRGTFLRPELPQAALHGLPGRVTRELADTSDADPAAILLAFLTMLGNATGAQPHVMVGGQEQPGRLYVLMVGEAATGRKGTALSLVEKLFDEADPEWAEYCHMTGVQSGEAVVSRVADEAGVSRDRRLLLIEPEYGRLLERMAGSTLSHILRRAWDGSPLAVDRVRSRTSIRATGQHISMIGQITPGELIRYYPKLSAGNGLESRVLYAYVTRQDRDVSPFASPADYGELAAQVGNAITRARIAALERTDPLSRELCQRRNLLPVTPMPLADNLERDWLKIRAGLPDVNRELGAFFDRDFTHVIRLGVLYALADGSPVLRRPHIRAATALWTYCARSAEVVFGLPAGRSPQAVTARRKAQVWEVLYAAHPGWLSTTELNDKFSRNTGKGRADISGIADTLVTEGRAEKRKITTAGRPRIEYRLRGINRKTVTQPPAQEEVTQ